MYVSQHGFCIMRAEGILLGIGKKKNFCTLIEQLYFYVRTTQSPIRCVQFIEKYFKWKLVNSYE
jgi:hypothetical protein